MKGKFIIAAALLPQFFFLGGCESFKDLGLEGRPRAYIKSPPAMWDGYLPPEGSALYVTCFEYPSGYDYIRDTLHGAGAKVALYRDGEKILSMPADGLDPDECRVVSGHLYTPLRHGGWTELRRDGEFLFSYDSEEILESLVSDGESVATLGRRPSEGGFCCRLDGVEKFTSSRGIPIGPSDGPGALHMDDEDYVFFYRIPMVGASGKKSLCYMVKNWEESQVSLPEDIIGIYDAICKDGTAYVCAENLAGGGSLFYEGNRVDILLGSGAKVTSLRLFTIGSKVYMTGFYTAPGKRYRMVWDSAAAVRYRLDLYDSNWIYPSESGYFCIDRREDDIRCFFGTGIILSTYGRLWSSRCADCLGKTMYMSVIDEGGGTSTLYRSDGTVAMTVGGVITEVCYSTLILPEDDP